MVNDIYIIRFAVCAKHPSNDDMHVAFRIIQEHADDVLEEYRAQRAGRQSSSNDSLDSSSKQSAAINNVDHETAVAEETVDAEALAETPVAPTACSPTKARVSGRSFFASHGVVHACALGQYHYDHDATPSRDLRKACLDPVEGQTTTANVRTHGLGRQSALPEAHDLSARSSVVVSHTACSEAHPERFGQSRDALGQREVPITHSEHSGNGQFGRGRTRRQAMRLGSPVNGE